MYRVKTPESLIRLFPKYLWRMPDTDRTVYLTFDDGPCKGVTDTLLSILSSKDVKASFFCLGKNINANPKLFHKIKEEGHFVGNHGWEHLDGWKTDATAYLENISKGQKMVGNRYFRPPYGRIPISLRNKITKNYHVVLWDVLSGDFDPNLTIENCLSGVIKHMQPGSIIVFHDNEKSKEKMLAIIPKLIDLLTEKKYTFGRL